MAVKNPLCKIRGKRVSNVAKAIKEMQAFDAVVEALKL